MGLWLLHPFDPSRVHANPIIMLPFVHPVKREIRGRGYLKCKYRPSSSFFVELWSRGHNARRGSSVDPVVWNVIEMSG